MRFQIYNMNTGETLGTYYAQSEDDALNAMAQDYGFANYADCISEYGVSLADAKAELQITLVD